MKEMEGIASLHVELLAANYILG